MFSGGTGLLNDRGCPTVEVEIRGAVGIKRKITALVDTGFSGFLLLPALEAFPVGLVLHGTANVTLADGSTHSKLTCLGVVEYGGDQQGGMIIVEETSSEALLGMEFLKKFKLTLFTDPDIPAVILLSSEVLKKALATAKIIPASAGTAPTSTSSGTPPSTPPPKP